MRKVAAGKAADIAKVEQARHPAHYATACGCGRGRAQSGEGSSRMAASQQGGSPQDGAGNDGLNGERNDGLNGSADAGVQAPLDGGRRHILTLGAAAGVAAVTVRPAFAQTAASAFNCEIPVPDPMNSSKYVALDGTLVPAGTQGAFPPAPRPFKGEEVRAALQGRALPGTSYEQGSAYMNYIRRLRAGQNGFTCYASIQMPR
jgi:hypothetical protein